MVALVVEDSSAADRVQSCKCNWPDLRQSVGTLSRDRKANKTCSEWASPKPALGRETAGIGARVTFLQLPFPDRLVGIETALTYNP